MFYDKRLFDKIPNEDRVIEPYLKVEEDYLMTVYFLSNLSHLDYEKPRKHFIQGLTNKRVENVDMKHRMKLTEAEISRTLKA